MWGAERPPPGTDGEHLGALLTGQGSVTEDGVLVCGCPCADTQGGCPEPSGSRAYQAFHKHIGAVVKTMGSESSQAWV